MKIFSLLLLLVTLLISCNQAKIKHVTIDSVSTKVPDSILIVRDTKIDPDNFYENGDRYVGEDKILSFTSDYQFNKNLDGTEETTYSEVNISFDDPKSSTTEGTPFEELPKGEMVIRNAGHPDVRQEIIFVAHNKNGYDIYAITDTETDSNIIYLIRSHHIVEGKSYQYTIVLGTSDLKGYDGLPPVFTAFHCN